MTVDVGKCVDICYSWVSGFAGLQVSSYTKDAENIGMEGERGRDGEEEGKRSEEKERGNLE